MNPWFLLLNQELRYVGGPPQGKLQNSGLSNKGILFCPKDQAIAEVLAWWEPMVIRHACK